MHRKHSVIPSNLRRIAERERRVGEMFPALRENCRVIADYLGNVAFHLEELFLEIDMARVAATIDRLEREKGDLRTDRDAEKRRADGLQAQLDAQKDKLLDDADLAALDRADHDAEATGDTTGGTGGADTLPGT